MKILYIIILFLITTAINAKPVDKKTAKTVAVNFMQNTYPNKSDYSIKSVIENRIKNINTTYIVEFNSGGYVIVSANDATIPVFLFSEDGKYEINNIPPAVQQWYDYYNKSVYITTVENYSNEKTINKWKQILYKNNKEGPVNDTIVAPLIKTEWGQSETNDDKCPGYNYYMPYNGGCPDDCDKCTAGCGAVAMAQIMRYWAHPYKIDNHYFDWCKMPVELLKFFSGTSNIRPQYETERNEIAKLIHICGVKTDMNYCVFGTCQSNAPQTTQKLHKRKRAFTEYTNIRRRTKRRYKTCRKSSTYASKN
ncbi:MAG: C10 family peptidase [Bacteroidales bacterium]|nr:C10 family peptidase [Bacteroidales bacterium]